MQPDYVVISNLARDSMLRNAHPAYIFGRLKEALAGSPNSVVIVNGDDPLAASWGKSTDGWCLVWPISIPIHCPPGRMTLPSARFAARNRCTAIGIIVKWGTSIALGAVCRRLSGTIFVTDIDHTSRCLTLRDSAGAESYPMVSCSLHNAYYLAPVIALFRDMGQAPSEICRDLEGIRVLASRESFEMVGGVKLVTHIAKGQNPTAVSTVFEFLAKDPALKEIILILDEVFDSPLKTETVSWIYDTDYEFLRQDCIRKIVLGGARYLDHRLRLLLAGVPAEKLVCLRQELDTADYVDFHGVEKIYILHDVNAISRGRQVRDLVKARILAERGESHEN